MVPKDDGGGQGGGVPGDPISDDISYEQSLIGILGLFEKSVC